MKAGLLSLILSFHTVELSLFLEHIPATQIRKLSSRSTMDLPQTTRPPRVQVLDKKVVGCSLHCFSRSPKVPSTLCVAYSVERAPCPGCDVMRHHKTRRPHSVVPFAKKKASTDDSGLSVPPVPKDQGVCRPTACLHYCVQRPRVDSTARASASWQTVAGSG